jgi:alpha-tubulin suppressor-like RCC1 family protein
MSSLLWKAYYEDDVDLFRQLLEASVANARQLGVRGGGGGHNGMNFSVGSPGGMSTSPTMLAKSRKSSAFGSLGLGNNGLTFSKADINWKDSHGMTILHHAASSDEESAVAFATALIEHPLIDLYVQDHENGWTALHRAFYFGNISVARMILERDVGDALGQTTGHVQQTIGLVKVKDREGHGPFDLYAATIKDRTLRPDVTDENRQDSDASDDEDGRMEADDDEENRRNQHVVYKQINGDELYTFGSNRNVSLGFGDEDDRQYPERISLRRPEHLLRRFYREYLKQQDRIWSAHDNSYESQVRTAKTTPLEDIPWVIRTKPLIIQDVLMAKLHTAVLTTDPESNLYICGHGQGGRLGVGDEQTRYNFVCVETGGLAGKKIATVALGQNHTLAISDKGEIFSWGNNGFGQLGYSLPKTSRSDEDPVSTVPQQIFGPLKREVVSGVAASRIHSVAYTGASLFTFGKNEGQLGIVDSDARSLEMQVTPRKVAASLFTSSIASVSAIDKATVCLLENHDVWIFANFGYAKVTFPLEGFSNHFLKQSFLVTSYDTAPNRIVKVTSGGDTVCALSSRGEVFTLSVAQRTGNQASSTTNPTKIRGAVSQPLCIWSLKTGNMAARDVGVDADGSILLTTEEGSVWQRTKRAKIKNATASGTGEYKPKDYKFSRVSGLTRVLAVRASAHGAYAAVRRDCDVTKTQIVVEDPTLWKDYLPLFALRPLATRLEQAEMAAEDRPRFWQGNRKPDEMQMLRRAILESKDLEKDLVDICDRALTDGSVKYDAVLTTKSSDLRIPVHRFLLTGRSRVLRNGLAKFSTEGDAFAIPDLAVCEVDGEGRTVISFQGYDILSLVDLALYLYSDQIIEFWHIRNVPQMSHRYRQVRTELMKLSSKLELVRLEPAVRQMIEPRPSLDMDFEVALRDAAFMQDSDVIVQLEDGEVRAHSVPLCTRCPFFEGLFMGRAGGRWLAGRDDEADVTVDLTHITVDTFNLVLRHLYADTGTELFDSIASSNLDEFLDLVLDVLGAANELMLDRLSQICQSVIGRYVSARNVCWLLNAISPSSVHEFKHASLEYLCLSLESMLQGHHLNELDEDLLVELDEVVRQNQLACMPFAKSGRAEEDLHERHPELAALLDRSRQVKIDSIRLRSKYQDVNAFAPGSLGDDGTHSPSQKGRRGSALAGKPEGEGPSLKAKASTKDMMFTMDEEMGSQYRSPGPSPAIKPMSTPKLEHIPSESPIDDGWLDARGKSITSPSPRPQQSSTPGAMTPRTPKSPPLAGRTPSSSGLPWTATPLAGPSKTGLKDIMAQASFGRTSSLSQGIESQKAAAEKSGSSPFSLPASKMSQKERKKMLQQQQSASAQSSARLNEAQVNAGTARGSPWQTVSAQKVPSLKDVFSKEVSPAPVQPPKPTQRAASTPHLTMRQTVANPKPTPPPQSKAVASPGTQHHQSPRRSVPVNKPPRPPPQQQQQNLDFPSIAQSIRHSPAPVEPSLQLSIADIVEQERLQKELLKEAVAKRDLGEIQAEQEFAEWWEKESRRVQGYEDETDGNGNAKGDAAKGGAKKAPRRKPRGDGAGRGRGKARGGGGGGGGGGAANGNGHGQGRGQSSQAQAQTQRG